MQKENPTKKTKSVSRVNFIIINIVRILLIIAFIGALSNGRYLVLFISALAFAVTFLPKILHKFLGIKIPAEFEVMTILFIYGTLFFGEVRGFYARFWWWDVLLNLTAAIALGLVGLTILYVLHKEDKIDASPIIISIFAFAFAFAIGSIWEIFEFVLDYYYHFNLQEASLIDTMTDIITNAIGALIVSIAGYYYIKSNKKNLVSRFITSFIERNPKFFRKEKAETAVGRIMELIKKGEGRRLEFKQTLRTNIHTKDTDKKVEHSILKTIVAYLNTDGGILLVGISDSGEITGIEKDKFPDLDKAAIHLTNLIKNKIGNEFVPLIKFETVEINEKHIIKIDVKESDKQVFLKTNEEEEFYVRNGPATQKLSGSALVEYINRKFTNR